MRAALNLFLAIGRATRRLQLAAKFYRRLHYPWNVAWAKAER